MKRSSSATTRSRGGGEVRISLFPFLAVLLCTMGALIVVLVVIARQARLQAEQLPIVATKSQALLELESAREMARWRISELKVSRDKTEADMAKVRLQLGGVEDHARQLREKLGQLKTAFAQLEASKGNQQQRAQLKLELVQLRDKIEDAKRRLAEAQRKEKKPSSYAIIPYEGPHGTRRRPIYLECRRDGVVLQPAGLLLGAADFDGPLGPGNPLEAALRASREYLLEHNQLAADGSREPYPLLLVRPSGIEAYYMAQSAMKSWNSEFGYELIGDDWALEFPPVDPVLTDKVKQVVSVARARQRRLALAVPSHSEDRSPKYRVAPYQGGVIPDGNAGGSDEPRPKPQQPTKRFANRVGSDSRASQTGESHSDTTGSPTGNAPSPDSTAGEPISPTAPSPPRHHPLRDRRPRENPSNQDASQGGSPLRPGEWRPQSPSDEKAGAKAAQVDQVPLAETRGANWGLPDATSGSVPISRPIRIDLFPDRLIIVPEQGVSQSKIIPLGDQTATAIDGTVSAIWDLMESWGIAGRGMYWRPVLSVYVAPNAISRYHDLATLLEGSGLDVQRR
jgi:hypothetical protein